MIKTLIKWYFLCAIGVCFFIITAIFFFRKAYTWVMAGLFIGLFLTSASWKRIGLLKKAGKALAEGKVEITVFYKDKNLQESQNKVIPAGADTSYFYGYVPARNDIKVFRWERIQRVLENGKELKKEDVLKKLPG